MLTILVKKKEKEKICNQFSHLKQLINNIYEEVKSEYQIIVVVIPHISVFVG